MACQEHWTQAASQHADVSLLLADMSLTAEQLSSLQHLVIDPRLLRWSDPALPLLSRLRTVRLVFTDGRWAGRWDACRPAEALSAMGHLPNLEMLSLLFKQAEIDRCSGRIISSAPCGQLCTVLLIA
jgi:hypothetical protein